MFHGPPTFGRHVRDHEAEISKGCDTDSMSKPYYKKCWVIFRGQKWPKINQLVIIHLLFKKLLWFFDIYVFGQDDQQNDKVGQGDQLREIVGQGSLYPPPNTRTWKQPCMCHSLV